MSLDIDAREMRKKHRPIRHTLGRYTLDGIDFSAVDQYLRCPRQYYHRHIKGRKEPPPGIALAEGIGHHTAMEMDNRRKIRKGKGLTAKRMTEIFVEDFRDHLRSFKKDCGKLKVTPDWKKPDKNVVEKRAPRFHESYVSGIGKKIRPKEAEPTVTTDIAIADVEFCLFGQIDVVERSRLLDYKVTARPRSVKEADNSLQLSLYSMIKRKRTVGYVNFVKSDGSVRLIESVRTDGQWEWAKRVVASVVEAIRRGSFPVTNPSAFPPPWWCSEKFCGYYHRCRGRHEGRSR